MEIECKFENDGWIWSNPNRVYTCAVTICNVTSCGCKIANFQGQHEASKGNNDVEALWFKDTNVIFFPRNLAQVFPNLVFLEINKCGLEEITSEDLVGLQQLETFWIPGNELETVPLDLFKNMPKLRAVSFSNNLFEKFDFKVLEPIKDTIEIFEIEDNPGISEKYEKKGDKMVSLMSLLALEASKEKSEKFEKISERFASLFDTGKHSDFTIKLRDKDYKVHKCILASQSSVFDKMFSEDAENATDSKKTLSNIENLGQNIFEDFLRYFYTRADPSEENAIDLLEYAVAFDVPDLKQQCATTINKTINHRNSLQIFNIAVRHSLQDLKQSAFDCLKNNHPEIGEFLYEKPELVNATIEAINEFQAKKIETDKKKTAEEQP